MDDRVTRLLDKAEKAVDNGNDDQADSYRALAMSTAYLVRKEIRMLNRIPVAEP